MTESAADTPAASYPLVRFVFSSILSLPKDVLSWLESGGVHEHGMHWRLTESSPAEYPICYYIVTGTGHGCTAG